MYVHSKEEAIVKIKGCILKENIKGFYYIKKLHGNGVIESYRNIVLENVNKVAENVKANLVAC